MSTRSTMLFVMSQTREGHGCLVPGETMGSWAPRAQKGSNFRKSSGADQVSDFWSDFVTDAREIEVRVAQQMKSSKLQLQRQIFEAQILWVFTTFSHTSC